jgi:hypothetical protein
MTTGTDGVGGPALTYRDVLGDGINPRDLAR